MLKTHGEKEIRFCVLCTWTRQMCLFFGLGVRFQTSEHYKCDWVSRCNYKKKEEMWGRCCTIASAQGSSRVFTPKLWMHADEAFSNWLEVGKKIPPGRPAATHWVLGGLDFLPRNVSGTFQTPHTLITSVSSHLLCFFPQPFLLFFPH